MHHVRYAVQTTLRRRRLFREVAGTYAVCQVNMEKQTKMEYSANHHRKPKFQPRIIIHGGAGQITPETLPPTLYHEYRASLLTVISKTHAYMLTPLPSPTASSRPLLPSSLAVSTYAVTLLEDNPLFNAGHGAVFTRDGTNELEASVMVSRGHSKCGVGVTGLKHVRSPILLAKALLEHGDSDLLIPSSSSSSAELNVPSAQGHTLLHGESAEILAKKYGLELVDPSYFFTQKRWDEHIRALEREKQGGLATYSKEEYLPQGTVGAVALDEEGVVCVATSTGGLTNKLTGRIGDTPSVGAGFWAEEWEETDFSSPPFASPGSPAVMLSGALKKLRADCLPTPFIYSPSLGVECRRVITTKALAVSGTGNGDSFLRTAAARTIGAIARWGGYQGRIAARKVSGPDGELQRSAGYRWGKTGEGQGGVIGIEAAITRDAETGEVVGTRTDLIQEFNCGGMFRAWVDEKGVAYAQVWRDGDKLSKEYRGETMPEQLKYWNSGRLM